MLQTDSVLLTEDPLSNFIVNSLKNKSLKLDFQERVRNPQQHSFFVASSDILKKFDEAVDERGDSPQEKDYKLLCGFWAR